MASLSLLVGESPGITAVREQVARILQRTPDGARRAPPILILGETGTGKGLLAELIHRAGPRAGGPFVDVNCAAIPEALLEAELFGFERGAFTDARQAKPGLFQAAHRGTIFLDEIGLMPLGLQAKLLKVIEERAVRRLGGTRPEAVDVWVVAATSEDLPDLVRARRFREDLYHRLAVITLRLPPLRERGADVHHLARHFLDGACRDYGLPPKDLDAGARAALLAHGWPGNVRELANVMERVALLSDEPTVTAAALDLPAPRPGAPRPRPGEERAAFAEAGAAGEAEAAEERERLSAALRAERGNLSRAAARLGLARNTLRYRLERLGLRPARADAPAAAGPPPGPAPGGPAAPAAGAPPADPGVPGPVPWEVRRVTLLRAALPARADEGSAAETGRMVEAVLDKVRSFGGQVTDLGDRGVTAAFGLGPLEDAPRRAAHAALAIRRMLARAPGAPAGPALRMGLHTESLPVGRAGDALGLEPEAGRRARATLDGLLERIQPGEIGVSAGAAQFLRGRFGIEGRGAGDPDAVHRLAGPGEPEREQTRFVGRERELRVLLELLERAEGGQGQAVTIVGEPGIGKSRLLREFRRIAGDRAGWVEGRVASGGRATPLGVLVDLLQRALGVEETDPEDVIVDKLERRALRFGEGIRPTLPFLRYLLSIDPGDPAVAAMDPTLRRAAIFDALRRVLFRAAERRPQVLVVEDVHWIDQASEEWLRLVADGMAARPVLLVLTSRPGAAPSIPDRTFHTRLALPALSGTDSVQMACALLAVEALPAPLQRLLVAKAEGNPFFLEELVRALQEVGAVRRAGDGLVVAGDVDGIAVPDTVQDVILSRIERLPAEPGAILEVAAVIGKDVPFDVLAAVAGRPEEALRAGLRELQAAEFLYETSLYPEWAHTFKHALTHDVAYARVPSERRRALHAAIVGAIERLHAGRLGDQAERLAAHARGGEVWGKALAYARQAGARAMARSANPEAVAYYEQALGALEHLPETPETAEQAIDVRFELRSALIPLGEVARILRCLREAEALAAARGDRRRLGWGSAYMTISYLLHAEHGRARETGERAVRLADEVGDAALAVVARAYWGHVFRELGDHARALALFGEVLGRLPGERARERFGQAVQPAVYALSLGALSCSALGDTAGAVRMADEGFRISEAADRPFGLALASLARAQVLTVRRAADEARALAERALVMIEARHLPLWRPWTLAVAGWADALGGRFAEAVPLLEEALALGARLPFLFGHSLWGIWLGLTHVLAGRPDDAAREGARGLAVTRQRGERGYEAWAQYLLGEAASRRPAPDLDAARAAYEAALGQATELGMRPLAAHCRHALGRVLDQAGRPAEAAALRDAAAEAYRTLDLRGWPVPAGAGGP